MTIKDGIKVGFGIFLATLVGNMIIAGIVLTARILAG